MKSNTDEVPKEQGTEEGLKNWRHECKGAQGQKSCQHECKSCWNKAEHGTQQWEWIQQGAWSTLQSDYRWKSRIMLFRKDRMEIGGWVGLSTSYSSVCICSPSHSSALPCSLDLGFSGRQCRNNIMKASLSSCIIWEIFQIIMWLQKTRRIFNVSFFASKIFLSTRCWQKSAFLTSEIF